MSQNNEQTTEDVKTDPTPDQNQVTEEVSETQSSDFVEVLNTQETKETEIDEAEANPKEKVPMAHQGQIKDDFFNIHEEWTATVLGQLPTGESLQVMKCTGNDSNMYRLAFREGLKSVPNGINGKFTSYDRAESAGRRS
jgi:hypothetical protein